MRKKDFTDMIDIYIKKDRLRIYRDYQSYRSHYADIEQIKAEDIFPTAQQIVIFPHLYDANELKTEHRHDYFELIYMVRGFCKQTINGCERDLKEGDILILSPRDTHAIATSSRDDILLNIFIKRELFNGAFLNLISDKDFISNFFLTSLFTLNAGKAYLYFPDIEDTACADMLHHLILEFFERKICWSKNMECYLAIFFAGLVRIHQQNIDRENEISEGTSQLTDILTYINDNKASVTLSTVAEKFHYHPNYLSALLKKHTQQNFTKILLNMRLQEACYYLKSTALPIDEILAKTGYFERSYFHKVFKKHYNMTPNEYREKYGKGVH
ncbi:MAG: AraC family transcriptional regulator [Lachnospiraceae bacterium]